MREERLFVVANSVYCHIIVSENDDRGLFDYTNDKIFAANVYVLDKSIAFDEIKRGYSSCTRDA